MRICDRCYHVGDYKPGAVPVTIGVEQVELCQSCAEEVRTMIFAPPPKPEPEEEEKRRSRPKKQ